MTVIEERGARPQGLTGNGKENEAATAKAGAQTGNAQPDIATSVCAVVPGKRDGRGESIDYVFFKRDDYAIYRSSQYVIVAYSDTKAVADQQIAMISGLLPLRDHLINLIKDLPHQSAKENYVAQIAEALRLGLEKQSEAAKAVIDEAVRDALDVQARIGRMVYLKWATGIALVVASALILGGAYAEGRNAVALLLMATGAGAIGALLSIAIGIRGRTVAIDGNWKANAMDAAVRVLIGIISASVLFLLLSSGFLTDIQAGAVKFTGTSLQWQAALLVGFAAGFLERLVPDLLEKSAPSSKQAITTPPANSGGVVSPVGNAGRQ